MLTSFNELENIDGILIKIDATKGKFITERRK
jgi:hypothetical protein